MAENFDSNPPKNLVFSEFPDYANLSNKYKQENIEEKFLEENGKTLDEYIGEHSKDEDDKAKKIELYCKLYAMQDREKEEPALSESGTATSTGIEFTKNGELCLAVKFEREDLGAFGLAIRDGKITFSSADLSPSQIKEAYHFLYMRGLASSIEMPSNLNDNLKDNIEGAIEEYIDKAEDGPAALFEPGEELTDGSYSQWLDWANGEEKSGQESSTPSNVPVKKSWNWKDDVLGEMEDWRKKQGERLNMNFFRGREDGWTVWTSYENMNIDNPNLENKKDKEGNIKAKWKYKIYAKMKNGKLQVGYATPPNGKLDKDVIEQVVKLAKSAGYNAINFHNVTDADLFEVRKACCKELVVPIGISIKPDSVTKMIEQARDYHPQGKAVAVFEKRLVDELKRRAEKKDPPVMNDSEQKLYDNVYVRANLSNFKPLYGGFLKGKLDELSKDGSSAIHTVAAANIVLDFYQSYKNAVQIGVPNSYVPSLYDIFTSDVKENKEGESQTRPLMTMSQINEFRSQFPGLDLKQVKMPDMTVKQLEVMYNIMTPTYEERAEKLLDDAYITSGHTGTPSKVASSALVNIHGKLVDDVSTDFRANVNLDGTKQLYDFGILLPAFGKISNPHYEPKQSVIDKRKIELAKISANSGGGRPPYAGGR